MLLTILAAGCAGALDSDGDGVVDGDELLMGLDPYAADTDGDGVDDGEELAEGTDPARPWSRPYAQGGYPRGDCDPQPDPARAGPSAEQVVGQGASQRRRTVYAPGDLVEDLVLQDRWGQDVHLWSFCGHTLLLSLGAAWCAPCQELAAALPALVERHEAEGFAALEVVLQDGSGGAPDAGTLAEWARAFDLGDIPVLGPVTADPALADPFDLDEALPSLVFIGPDLRALAVDTPDHDPRPWL